MNTTFLFLKKLIVLSCTLLLLAILPQCHPREKKLQLDFPGKPVTPSSIKKEHEYLLEKIQAISQLKDSTGRVAVKLNDLMKHHFSEEENFVLPPLGILPQLASGEIPEASQDIIGLTEKLKASYQHMNAEHQLIKAFMDELVQAASLENHPEVRVLKEELHKHATLEEEILFPGAILIGEFLKLKTTD